MARLTKKDFKGLLKECLREILLEEGMIGSTSSANKLVVSENKQLNRNNLKNNKLVEEPKINNPVLMENIQRLSSAAGEKASLYAKLLEDTAVTTLQEQNLPGEKGAIKVESVYTEEHLQEDLSALQGLSDDGNISKWAQIAFSKK